MARVENYDGNLQSNLPQHTLYGGQNLSAQYPGYLGNAQQQQQLYLAYSGMAQQNFGYQPQQFIPNQPVMRNTIIFTISNDDLYFHFCFCKYLSNCLGKRGKSSII